MSVGSRNSRHGSASRRQPLHLFGLNHNAQREEAIVRRRENQRMKDEFWKSTANYFDRVHNSSERFASWNSPEMIKKSEEAYRKAKMAENRKSNLHSRRSKLRSKLETEDQINLEKIKRMPVVQKSLKDVRTEYEEMKLKRIEEEDKEAEEKMVHHWKINNPDYRELQCKKRFEMVQKAWDEQKAQKEAKELAEQRHEEIRLRVEAEKSLRKDEQERQEQKDKEQKIENWKKIILEQISELKQRRKEEEQIKRDIASESAKEKAMDDMERKRRKIEEKRRAQDLSEFLTRQHRLKLLTKAEQVQKDLEEDIRLLDEVNAFSAVRNETEMEDRSEKNQRLGWLRQVIDRQKEEEVKRQKEMEMLFSEEAEKMWNKQEAIWNREEEARKKLMDDVLDGLKEQTRSKLQEKQRQEEMVGNERMKIEEHINKLSQDIEKEEEANKKKKDLFVEDLDKQVEEKKQIQTRKNRAELFRQTNELSDRLTKLYMNKDEPGITDFRRKKVKWMS